MVIKTKITSSGDGIDRLVKGLNNIQSMTGNHPAICPICGSTKMHFDDQGGDDTPVTCECGHPMGTKADVAQGIKDRILKEIKNGFLR